jgi:hypothetical protein
MGMPDIFRRFRRPASAPTEYYQRPHTYSIGVGLVKVCLSPNKQRGSALTLLAQADLANTGIISIGDSQLTLGVGIQLDSGKAAMFTPSQLNQNQIGALGTGLSQFMAEAPYDASGAIPQSLGTELGVGIPIRVLIDIADFWAISDTADQRLRIFWVEGVRVP